MSPRLLLLACLAVGACLAARRGRRGQGVRHRARELRARETRALARETGTLVGTAKRANLLHLWLIKEIRPVSESAATDYLIVERWCLLDKPAAAGGSRRSLVGWSTVTVRSLVNPLPING